MVGLKLKKITTPKEFTQIILHLQQKLQHHKDFLKHKKLEKKYLNYELKRLEKNK